MNEAERQKQMEVSLSEIAKMVEFFIESEFGKMGFALLVFDFEKPGIGNYVSNARRAEMISALRETADRLEGGQDIPPAGSTVH